MGNSSSKAYGSSKQKCPLAEKEAIIVMVADHLRAAVGGIKVALTDVTRAQQSGTTSGGGIANFTVPKGASTVQIVLNDDQKLKYIAPAAQSSSAGVRTIKLEPLKRSLRPQITAADPSAKYDFDAHKTPAIPITLQVEQSHPDLLVACPVELHRSESMKIYTDAGCTAEVPFTGKVAKLQSTDLAQPVNYWVQGTDPAKSGLLLVVPDPGIENVTVHRGHLVAFTFLVDEVEVEITKLDAKLVPGGTRKTTIEYSIDDHNIVTEAVVEAVTPGATTQLKKLTFPGDKQDSQNYTLDWDGKKPSGEVMDVGDVTIRVTTTDKLGRKAKDEKIIAIGKPGTIKVKAVHGDLSVQFGLDTVKLDKIKIKHEATGTTKDSDENGDGTHDDIVPGNHSITATLSDDLAKTYEIITLTKVVLVNDGEEVPLEFQVQPLATMKFTFMSGTTPVKGVKVKLGDKKVADKDTDANGVADFGVMPFGGYSVDVALTTSNDNDKTYMPPTVVARVDLGRGDQYALTTAVVEMPALDVTVKCAAPAKDLEGVTVKLTKDGKELTVKTTPAGLAAFPRVPIGDHKVDLVYEGDNLKNYELPAQSTFGAVAGPKATLPIVVEPKKCPVFLAPKIKLPDDSEHQLPEKLVLRLRTEDDKTITGKLNDKGVFMDDAGKPVKVIRFQKFTVEIPQTANTYVVIEKTGADPKTQELIEDADPKFDSKLWIAIAAGKRALLLPQLDAKLIQIDVDVAPTDNFATPNFDFKDKETIGTAEAPVKLLIKPKWQYARFEFYDRKYGKDKHGDKRIGIPPMLLKAARKSTSGAIGTVETAACFGVSDTDNAKSCLAIPWFFTKKLADGTPLDKLTKELHLEFGLENAWVQSTSATARSVVKLDPLVTTDKAKILPNKDRDQYYDLPKQWKSCNYYTRLTATTGKFFDELSETEIEAAYDKSKPLTFSLDDLVLTKNDGSQVVKDRNKTHVEIDRSKYSRFAILHHDATDTFEIKVWKPRTDAVFHTDYLFTKEAAAAVYRNYLIDYPGNPRVVVFCNGFHDVWNKRTESADCADKAVCGARAAKLEDTDVSLKKRFESGTDTTAGYVHRTRSFDGYYLHGGATDGTTVFSAIVSHFSVRAFSLNADRPTGWSLTDKPLTNVAADARNYRNLGMKNGMVRWNEKKYQLEQADKGTDVVIKLFALFESKDIEDPLNTMNVTGGQHHADLGVCKDTGRSSATDVSMYMRESAFRDEATGTRGSLPTPTSAPGDYAGAGRDRNALAHELGHAVIALWDDYITETQYGQPSFQKIQRYPGVHLNRDVPSMMTTNQLTRVRSYWGRCRWVNDEAKATKSLNPFLAAKKFVATYAPPGKDKLFYSLPDAVPSFWTPVHTQDVVALGEQGKAAVHLYVLGSDEFSTSLPDGPYDSMVVIDTRLAIEYCPGLDPAPKDWKDGVAYVIGNVADFEADFYVCIEAHPSSAEFATDSAKWVKLDPAQNYDWGAGTIPTLGDFVEDGGQQYAAIKTDELGLKIDDFFLAKGTDQGPWADNTVYAEGDTVDDGGQEYICKTGHTSGPAFAGANWIAIGTDHGAYTGGITFAVGDVMSDGSDYVCLTAHESETAEADEKAKRLVKCDCAVAEWIDPTVITPPATKVNESEQKAYLNTLNKALVKALEDVGAKGKFRFTRDGDTFSKIYVRVFPQYFDVTRGAAPAGGAPHFTIKVKKSDSKGFGASGADIAMSKKVNFNTLARYIYGRVSDDRATRKTQTPTADFALADLAKVKEWIDGKLGGTVTGEALAATPVVSSLSPPDGAAVGDTVTFTGERFTGATKVTFNGTVQATVSGVSATSLTAKVPPGATFGRVKVFTPKGSGTSPQGYKILPKITALAPTTAVAEGAEITITGTDLAGVIGVKVNTKEATFTPGTGTEVKAKIPVGATTGTVEVTTRAGVATSTASVTILPPPTVASFTPTTAKVGDEVTITGTNLDTATEVKIGGVAATVVTKTATEIKAKVGASAANGTVLVTTPGGAASAPGYILGT